ncbi:hypothetical protein E2I00_013908, partial [Balaenoptera physalus]
FWHKACFHCETCKMTLNMKNYKGYEKKPYCNAHYPKQSFTMVADTPENLRLKQQSELQSQHFLPPQIKYHEEFEKSRMGPSGGEGLEPERRDPQDTGYRRPQEQQPHHIPTSAPGEREASPRGETQPLLQNTRHQQMCTQRQKPLSSVAVE